jgi:hypothetical protein
MKPIRAILLSVVLAVCSAQAADRWKTVEDGFRLTIPWDWQKKKVQGIDSHVGEYRGKTAYLEFDEVFGLGYTNERAQKVIADLKSKEADPKLLSAGEEVWHVDGRIARFSIGAADPTVYGNREFKNVATLFVPYEGEGGYLHVLIFYESEKDVAVTRRILRSFEWKKKAQPVGTDNSGAAPRRV